MRIAYVDCLPVGGGLSRYSLGLCRNLLKFNKELSIDYYIHHNNLEKMQELNGISRLHIFPLETTKPMHRITFRIKKLFEKILHLKAGESMEDEISRRIGKRSYDVVYFPSAHMMPMPDLQLRLVATMHDFNWKYFFGSKIFSDDFCRQMDVEIPKWLQHAEVITLSHATLDECKKLFPSLSRYPQVIPVGALTVYSDMTRERASQLLTQHGINFPYIIYPANLFPHKNHLNLYTAFHLLKQNEKYSNLKLILTGAGTDQIGYGKAEYRGLLKVDAKLNYFNEVDIVGLGYTSNEMMDALIYNAEILISASIYEEMCQPAMDAWQLGTPTALSNIPPFKEHETNIGVVSKYFDPMDPRDISRTLEYCLENKDEMQSNAKISAEKMSQYTWDKVCEKYMEVFNKAALCR